MPERSNVLVLDASLGYTGAFKSILSICTKLSEQYSFSFMIPRHSRNNLILEESGFPVHQVNLGKLSKSFFSLLTFLPVFASSVFKLIRTIKKDKIELLHVNDYYILHGYVAKKFLPKIRLICHVRLLPNSYLGKVDRMLRNIAIRYADKVIAVSEGVKSSLGDAENVELIFDGLDITRNSVKDPVRESKCRGVQFLYPANYTIGKGQDLALKAFLKAREEREDIRLKFVGDTFGLQKNINFKEQIRSAARDSVYEEDIEISGFARNLETEMKECDVVLVLSQSESFSFVTLEALSAGIPCIATDCGGPSEIIENGKSGIIVPLDRIDEIKDAMLRVSDSEDLRKSLGEKGRQRAREKFDIKHSILQFEKLYRGLLDHA